MAKILISGSSGSIGRKLVPYLEKLGHTVSAYDRNNPQGLEGFDVVINLAGSSLFGKKELIYSSRIDTTRRLVEAMKACKVPPKVFISASAVGYYGKGFLADLCAKWEDEAMQASVLGVRVVLLRLGVVLTPDGGMLGKVIPLFRLGAGAVLGSGDQWMSWISIRDLLSLFRYCLETNIFGPVDAVSPNPVTNKEFTYALAASLHRPVLFRAPVWALKLIFGSEFADEAMLSSIKVLPNKLLATDFKFQDEKIEQALVSYTSEKGCL